MNSHCRIDPVLHGSGDSSKPYSAEAFHVVTLPEKEKQLLFRESYSVSNVIRQRAENILAGIKNSTVKSLFGYKINAITEAPFRIVKESSSSVPTTIHYETQESREGEYQRGQNRQTKHSFIALSYCWNIPNKAQPDETRSFQESSDSKIPISPVLFSAILAERVSSDEGIWIDQLCINQSDEEEKALAIGSMDIIYRSARQVAVALEDALLDREDEKALQDWIALSKEIGARNFDPSESPLNKALGIRLSRIMWKVFSARWFTRAWCGHELRVSDNQLFFIRFRQDVDSGTAPLVAKMSAPFLYDLLLIAASTASYSSVDEFADMAARYRKQRAQFGRYILSKIDAFERFKKEKVVVPSQDNANINDVDSNNENSLAIAEESRVLKTSYMQEFSSVFLFDSSVVSDRLSIVLNVLQCGLYLQRSWPSMTPHQCCYLFTHIALAAHDPTALVLTGERLTSSTITDTRLLTHASSPRSFMFPGSRGDTCYDDHHGGSPSQFTSWMRWPRPGDIIEPYSQRDHRCLEEPVTFDDAAFTLDLILLSTSLSSDIQRARPDDIAWANRLMDACIELMPGFDGRGNVLFEDLTGDDIPNMEPTSSPPALNRRAWYAELLACIRACGIEWLVRSWRAKDPSLFDDWNERGIRRVMAATFGPDEPTIPPPSRSSESTSEDTSWLDQAAEESNISREEAYFLPLVNLVDGLVGVWLPEDSPGRPSRPGWIEGGAGTRWPSFDTVLLLAPDIVSDNPLVIAMPTSLVHPEHGYLRRVWFMRPLSGNASAPSGAGLPADFISEPDEHFAQCNSWLLSVKGCSFGPVDFETLKKEARIKYAQKIF